TVGPLPPTSGAWTTFIGRAGGNTTSGAGINTSGVHGTGAIEVTGARFVTDRGDDACMLLHGEPITLEIDYEIRDRNLSERAQVVVAVHRDGVQDVCRYIARDLCFDGARKPCG